MALLKIAVESTAAERTNKGICSVLASNRFQPDYHAREMMTVAGEVLRANLSAAVIDGLRLAGTGKGAPVLYVEGLPKQDPVSATPFRGFGDEAKTGFADLLLLGLYDIMEIEPVALAFANARHLFRNVVSNPDFKGQKRSTSSSRRSL